MMDPPNKASTKPARCGVRGPAITPRVARFSKELAPERVDQEFRAYLRSRQNQVGLTFPMSSFYNVLSELVQVTGSGLRTI